MGFSRVIHNDSNSCMVMALITDLMRVSGCHSVTKSYVTILMQHPEILFVQIGRVMKGF